MLKNLNKRMVDQVNDILISRIKMECPLCGEVHLVEERERDSTAIIKDEKISYKQKYYRCVNSDEDEACFIPASLMNENLLAARNAYRTAHHMLTSNEIVALRKQFGLTQKDFAKMLGWGEATVARYETKLIQDETHDDVLKKVREDALEARKYLERNRTQFPAEQYAGVLEIINQEIERTSSKFLTKKKIEASYIRYVDDHEANGGVILNIDKVCNMIKFFANHSSELFKVKLMKLLWYSDALSYKQYGHAMSGLVYQHMKMGALPIANRDLMDLVPVQILEDELNQVVSYKLLPSLDFDESVFSKEEQEVLCAVLKKFRNYTGKDIAAYMHEEVAYTQTAERGIIPYSLSKQIRDF